MQIKINHKIKIHIWLGLEENKKIPRDNKKEYQDNTRVVKKNEARVSLEHIKEHRAQGINICALDNSRRGLEFIQRKEA